MAGAYTRALRDIKRRQEPEEVLGLAFADDPQNTAVAATYPGNPENYTACLNVAAELTEVLAVGAGHTHHEGPGLEPAAQAIAARNSVLHIVYGDHAMVLISSQDHLESLEAWAGRRPGTPNAVIVQSFDDCLFNRADEINITHQEAQDAVAGLLQANQDDRADAWNTISRAGLQGFESNRGRRNLTIAIRPLKTTAAAAQAMRARVDTAKRWAAIGLWATNQRLACWECLRVHGPTPGGFFGQWHNCENLDCGATFCDWCGDKLQYWSYTSRTRRCRHCDGQTELTAGP